MGAAIGIGLAGVAGKGGDGFEIVGNAGGGRDLGVVRPGRGEAVARLGVVEEVTLIGEARREFGPDGHDALMGTIGLVGGEHVDVGAERGDVGQAVRRVADAVDHERRAGGAHEGRDLGDGMDFTHDVGAVRHGDEADLVVEQRAEGSEIEAAGVGRDGPFAHLDALAGETPPGAGIGLVILIGDDDGVAGLEQAAEGMAQHIGIGRSRGAEMDPVGRHPEGGAHALIGFVHGTTGGRGGG